MSEHIKKIIIVGGGTAGWMAASTLSHMLSGMKCDIILIESEEIGTVGVGEATIPPILLFNEMLGIDENLFIKETQATFKLGIEFVNWKKIGHRYIHPFGDFGVNFDVRPFHQHWLNQRAKGYGRDLFDYSLMVQACHKKKFMRPLRDQPKSALAGINYAFQFDASLYAKFLRQYSEKRGVVRIEGKIESVTQHNETGFIESVTTEDKRIFGADLFIDCSGFKGLLIEQTLKTGYEDWSEWLPCDRAIAIPCEKIAEPIPYTRATAHEAGWQWRIPLQHRTGNGHVYCSHYMDSDRATDILLKNLDGKPIANPNHLRFTTGRRKKFWNKNVIALGLAAGFMEPLESTSIHLVQTGLARIMSHFPNKGFVQADIDSFNERTLYEYERVRDFLVLHYNLTERDDSEFWRYCQNIKRSEILDRKIGQFAGHGRIIENNNDLFGSASWLAVMYGQGISPKYYDPITDQADPERVNAVMEQIYSAISNGANSMPSHYDFIKENCLT